MNKMDSKFRIRLRKIALCLVAGISLFAIAKDHSLVILHTNDTHSQIEPDANGAGGILQRKALIDSVRKAEKNVILVDAGDIVQGSLFFKFFKGDVEYPIMNMMDYDIRILGNHEFDNGMEELARQYKTVRGDRLSANYDFTGTPLEGVFSPWVIKKIDGKKIGFLGLNVDPASLISKSATEGMTYKEIIPVANEIAAMLRNDKKCDLVIAVTHIGAKKENDKTTDYELAAASKDIDIIIGGHSHTLIKPGNEGEFPSIVMNADGRPVLIVQTGKYGKYIGEIKIDLNSLPGEDASLFDYKLLPVTDRFPADKLDKRIIAFLEPYRAKVDSINNHKVARSSVGLDSDDRNGGYANLAADIVYEYGLHKTDSLKREIPDFPSLDFAIMNVGGIRMNMPEGDVTEGLILNTFPFSNHLVISRIKGQDVIDALKVAASKGGEAISRQLMVVVNQNNEVEKVLLNGREMDPDAVYSYATIDYLAGGNDDLITLGNGETIWRDEVEVSAPILRAISRYGEWGIPVQVDLRGRFVRKDL